MLRTSKPIVATGMLVLYAGMMLLGESLHQFLGCEHCHAPSRSVSNSVAQATGATMSAAVADMEDEHNPETCPLCQFHVQGQLVPSLAGGELSQVVTDAPPVCAPLVFVVLAPSVHAARPPPTA